MKRILATIAAAVLLAFSSSAQDAGNVIPFADPFILYEDGLYYLYGTGAADGISVVVSEDMKTWTWPRGKEMYLALDKKDSYGDRWFWAPEVYKVDDRYIMYYSAQERICMAEADSPLGPFTQVQKLPMRSDGSIDNHLFIDDDSKPYLFWVHFNNGNEVWMAELEDDYKTIKPGTERFCLRMDQEWEKKWPAVNEGPFVLKHKGLYYLTYSANSYESPDYGVGYAVAETLTGPWVKYEGNPVLHRTGGLEGVGHHAFFKDAEGRDRIVFHSHNMSGKIHPRKIHIGTYGFSKAKGGKRTLVIDEDFFTPQMASGDRFENPVYEKSTPDPSVIEHDGMFYMIATEDTRNLPILVSRDMVNWKLCGTVFTDENRPDFVPGGGIWAPDINRIGDKFVLYYSMSVWGGIWTCGIGAAVADSPMGPWTNVGKLFDSTSIGVVNSIDPFYIRDRGRNYLFWGSLGGGLWGIELSADGLSVKEGAQKEQVAGDIYEATYIHKKDGWYYLFASMSSCCEGFNSKYMVGVTRSRNIFGPYVNSKGERMLDNRHELLVRGDGEDFFGPGHNSEIITDRNGQDWMFYHSYMKKTGNRKRVPVLDKVYWKDGWPVINNGYPSLSSDKPVF